MNEIISTLERAKERADAEFPATAYMRGDTGDLTYQALISLGLKYLGQTLFIFRHAREVKQARDKPKHSFLGSVESPRGSCVYPVGEQLPPPGKETDASR